MENIFRSFKVAAYIGIFLKKYLRSIGNYISAFFKIEKCLDHKFWLRSEQKGSPTDI